MMKNALLPYAGARDASRPVKKLAVPDVSSPSSNDKARDHLLFALLSFGALSMLVVLTSVVSDGKLTFATLSEIVCDKGASASGKIFMPALLLPALFLLRSDYAYRLPNVHAYSEHVSFDWFLTFVRHCVVPACLIGVAVFPALLELGYYHEETRLFSDPKHHSKEMAAAAALSGERFMAVQEAQMFCQGAALFLAFSAFCLCEFWVIFHGNLDSRELWYRRLGLSVLIALMFLYLLNKFLDSANLMSSVVFVMFVVRLADVFRPNKKHLLKDCADAYSKGDSTTRWYVLVHLFDVLLLGALLLLLPAIWVRHHHIKWAPSCIAKAWTFRFELTIGAAFIWQHQLIWAFSGNKKGHWRAPWPLFAALIPLAYDIATRYGFVYWTTFSIPLQIVLFLSLARAAFAVLETKHKTRTLQSPPVAMMLAIFFMIGVQILRLNKNQPWVNSAVIGSWLLAEMVLLGSRFFNAEAMFIGEQLQQDALDAAEPMKWHQKWSSAAFYKQLFDQGRNPVFRICIALWLAIEKIDISYLVLDLVGICMIVNAGGLLVVYLLWPKLTQELSFDVFATKLGAKPQEATTVAPPPSPERTSDDAASGVFCDANSDAASSVGDDDEDEEAGEERPLLKKSMSQESIRGLADVPRVKNGFAAFMWKKASPSASCDDAASVVSMSFETVGDTEEARDDPKPEDSRDKAAQDLPKPQMQPSQIVKTAPRLM